MATKYRELINAPCRAADTATEKHHPSGSERRSRGARVVDGRQHGEDVPIAMGDGANSCNTKPVSIGTKE